MEECFQIPFFSTAEGTASRRDELIRNAVRIARNISAMEGVDVGRRRRVMINVNIKPKYFRGKLTDDTKDLLTRKVAKGKNLNKDSYTLKV